MQDSAATEAGPPARGRRPLPPVPRVLWALVAVMGLIEITLTLADRGVIGAPWWRAWAIAMGGFHDQLFDGEVAPLYPGQPIAMFFTHAFLHGDIMHFALNAVVLLAVGKVNAAIAGHWRLLLLFLICAIGGALCFGLVAHTDSPMVGASGAVFGFLGFWKYNEWRLRVLSGLPQRPVWATVAALAVANVLVWLLMSGLVAWEAHLGGFVAGWLVGWLWRPVSRPGESLIEPPPG
ncbi:MAG: rhomboid family intramembrane serine protease [Paracoccaceae bacterium]|nr:MAG: rhomboid family intramembrane serine protease [Paracoccaceae bacterium]